MIRLVVGIARPDVFAQCLCIWAIVVLLWSTERPERMGPHVTGGFLAAAAAGFMFNAVTALVVLGAWQVGRLVLTRGASVRALLGFGLGAGAGLVPVLILIAARFDYFPWNYNFAWASW
jgi:hypothetical protein